MTRLGSVVDKTVFMLIWLLVAKVMLVLKNGSQIFVPELSLLLLLLMMMMIIMMVLLLFLLLMMIMMMVLSLLLMMMIMMSLLMMMMLNFQFNPRIRELNTPLRRRHHLRVLTIHLRRFA
jgi:hypothetical protein